MTQDEFSTVFAKHDRMIYSQMIRAGIPMDEFADVMGETYQYAVERLDRYDPNKASITTWLYNQARGAISRHQRRQTKFYSRLGQIDRRQSYPEDECGITVIENAPDLTQLTGRDIEDQMGEREILAEVLRVAAERGIDVNGRRLTAAKAAELRAVWAEVEARYNDEDDRTGYGF